MSAAGGPVMSAAGAGRGAARSGRYLLGIDIGTFSSKGVLVHQDGEVAAERTVEHSLDIPPPGRAEHDPEKVWWGDFTRICRELLAASGVKPVSIAAIGISTISPAVVAVDAGGRALRPAILYGINTRATAEIAELSAATGASLDSQSASPKVLWIRRHEPEVWARTRWILNGSGWLNLRLTGERTIDIYDASIFLPYYDAISGAWSKEIAPLVAPLEMMPQPTWTSGSWVTSPRRLPGKLGWPVERRSSPAPRMRRQRLWPLVWAPPVK